MVPEAAGLFVLPALKFWAPDMLQKKNKKTKQRYAYEHTHNVYNTHQNTNKGTVHTKSKTHFFYYYLVLFINPD